MAHHTPPVHLLWCVLLAGCILSTSYARYTSEETNEQSKTVFNAQSSVTGASENSRQLRTRTYDQPAVGAGTGAGAAASTGYGRSAGVAGLYHNGPLAAPNDGGYGAGGDVGYVPTGTSYSQHPAGVGSTLPRGEHHSLAAETEDIDYPRGHVGAQELNPEVTGAGKFDVRSSYPATKGNSIPPGQTGYPTADVGFSTRTAGGPASSPPYTPGYSQGSDVGSGFPTGLAGGAPNSAPPYLPGHQPQSSYGAASAGGYGHGLSPGYNLPASSYPYPAGGAPSYQPPTGAYPYPATPAGYMPPNSGANYPYAQHNHGPQQPWAGQPHNHHHPHHHQYGYDGDRGHSHLDHSLKSNTEYKEVGHHVGPFQGSTGYGYGSGYGGGAAGGYNGAFNRPIY